MQERLFRLPRHFVDESSVKSATFIDKETLASATYPQSSMNYETGDNILWDAIGVDASVYGYDFTDNGIEVWYYQDPDY